MGETKRPVILKRRMHDTASECLTKDESIADGCRSANAASVAQDNPTQQAGGDRTPVRKRDIHLLVIANPSHAGGKAYRHWLGRQSPPVSRWSSCEVGYDADQTLAPVALAAFMGELRGLVTVLGGGLR